MDDKKQENIQGNILIVDDNVAILRSLSDILSIKGHQVHIATDGKSALRRVASKQPELILLDYKMQGMNGIEVCRRIKSNPETADIPIIFLSGHGDIGLKILALEMGGIDYVIKPFQPMELLAKIDNHLKISRLQRKLVEQTEQLKEEVDERRRVEAELRQSQEFLSSIIDQTPLATWIVDTEGTVIRLNDACRRLFGNCSDDQVIGKYNLFRDSVFRENGHAEIIKKVFTTGHIGRFCVDYDFALLAMGKRSRAPQKILDTTIFPITVEDGSVTHAIIQHDDISKRKKMEEQLFQNEKLRTIAGLAAGIAHEINTPLSAILQAHQLLEIGLSPGERVSKDNAAACDVDLIAVQEYLKKNDLDYFMNGIRKSALKAGHIIKSLLEFSHPHEGAFAPVDLKHVIDQSLLLAQADYEMKKRYGVSTVTIAKEYAKEMPLVSCVSVEIEQVLLNLIKNSVQALGEMDMQEDPRIILRLAVRDNLAQIEVEDNGPGIAKDVEKYIFDPFFTTKEVGNGTGLGLSISRTIISDKHNGKLWVDSKSGRGARFIVELPLHQED